MIIVGNDIMKVMHSTLLILLKFLILELLLIDRSLVLVYMMIYMSLVSIFVTGLYMYLLFIKPSLSTITISLQYFAEEGNKLFRSVREFVGQVPDCQLRSELMMYLEQIPSHCQQLNFTTKSPSAGKSSTFNKVRKIRLSRPCSDIMLIHVRSFPSFDFVCSLLFNSTCFPTYILLIYTFKYHFLWFLNHYFCIIFYVFFLIGLH